MSGRLYEFVFELSRKKDANKTADKLQFAEYKERLGTKVTGRSFDKWQEMKYTDPQKYNELKTLYKQANSVDKSAGNGIMKAGAISGALNPYDKRASEHAARYYESVRKMKTDVKNIAKHTGLHEEKIQEVKNFIFMEKHDLGGSEPEYFTPSYEMAQSWQRLIDGKDIKKHDLTLLHHEIMEKDLMNQGYSQDKAHILASEKYDYRKESDEYYAKIN